METKDLLRKVRKIELKTRGLTNHIFTGEYHSRFKGRGMSFSEVREYQYGDDIRNIDWNVTARFDTPYVKVFEEERELTVMLLVDVSRSSFLGTLNQTKKETIAEICAVIAFSAINNNDKVGLLFFSDHNELYLAPKKGKQHILRIIRELLDFEPRSTRTSIATALEGFSHTVKKRSIVFVISDFLDDHYFEPLSHLARKHDVIGIRVHDRLDHELPEAGLLQLCDAETGKMTWIDTSDAGVRKAYRDRAEHFKKTYTQSFGKAGADMLDIRTDEPYVQVLMNFFKRR